MSKDLTPWVQEMIARLKAIPLENVFISAFSAKLQEVHQRKNGDKHAIAGALEAGLDAFFTQHRWSREKQLETVTDEANCPSNMPFRNKVDRAYMHGEKVVFVEVKSTLEFNALAAAIVEAMLFKKETTKSTFFIVLSLTTKSISEVRALEIVSMVYPERTIDGVFILLPENDKDKFGQYLENGVRKLSEWFNGIQPQQQTD